MPLTMEVMEKKIANNEMTIMFQYPDTVLEQQLRIAGGQTALLKYPRFLFIPSRLSLSRNRKIARTSHMGHRLHSFFSLSLFHIHKYAVLGSLRFFSYLRGEFVRRSERHSGVLSSLAEYSGCIS
jgi:hypothetical protein